MSSWLAPSRRSPRPLLPLLLGLALVLAAACTTEEQASPASEDFSSAGVAFLQGMIPHHEQAVEMAELVPDRTEREELVGLAEAIAEQQSAEIGEMEDLLDQAGAEPPDAAAAGDVHDDIGGMLSDDELTDLRGLDGTPFDLTFLDRMISHHRGAVADAREAVDDARHPEVRALAERVIDRQEAEIEQMQTWRGEWEAEDG